jgi:hypothetical protein
MSHRNGTLGPREPIVLCERSKTCQWDVNHAQEKFLPKGWYMVVAHVKRSFVAQAVATVEDKSKL